MKMMKSPTRLLTTLLIAALLSPVASSAKNLPNRGKSMTQDLSKCEKEVKRLSSLGYPDQAEKQLGKCQKIQGSIAKMERAQDKVDRKLASLQEAKKKKHKNKSKKPKGKKSQKKKKKVNPAE